MAGTFATLVRESSLVCEILGSSQPSFQLVMEEMRYVFAVRWSAHRFSVGPIDKRRSCKRNYLHILSRLSARLRLRSLLSSMVRPYRWYFLPRFLRFALSSCEVWQPLVARLKLVANASLTAARALLGICAGIIGAPGPSLLLGSGRFRAFRCRALGGSFGICARLSTLPGSAAGSG